MKSYFDGRVWGEALCMDVNNRVASIERVKEIAKKKMSEYEQGKIDACIDWLDLHEAEQLRLRAVERAKEARDVTKKTS